MKSIVTFIALLLGIVVHSQTITVTSPSGGDTLVGGQTYTITWTATGITDSVRLQYKRGGLIYNIQKVYNTGSYQWTVPATISSSSFGYIKIIEDKFNPAFDENDLPFRFEEAPKSIMVTFPNSATDTIYSGIPNIITWNSTGVMSKVHIYQSRNGGAGYSRISPYSGSINNGTFTWTPPNSYQSNEFKIKVEGYGTANSQYFDTSNVNTYIKIGKTFDLLTPQPKNLVVGNTEQITWTSTGGVTHVDIEYSTDWSPWKSIADSIPNSGSYSWQVPLDSGSSVRLRIIENNNPSVEKQVYGFSMTSSPQVLAIVYPNGGEVFTEGDSVNIQWTRSSNLTGVGLDIYYSLDSGLTWVFITDHIVTNNFHWNAPLNVNSTACLVRVFVHGVQSVSDHSDSTFSINPGPPGVRILSPNGGGKYLAGTTRYFYFQTQGGVDTVDFDFSIDAGATYNAILDSIPSSNLNVPIIFPDVHSDNAILRIKASNLTGIQDETDAVFFIRKFLLNQPYTNQVFYQGSTSNITWSSINTTSTNVSLYYSLNLGQTWNLIDNNVSNTGSYSWSVPGVQSDSAKIRIVDNSNSGYFDETTQYFKIVPNPITITSPNGGEYLNGSTYYPITWTTDSNSYISTVRVKYSLDSGQTWLLINNYYTNSGSYNWYTPNIINSNVLVRIENRSGGGVPSDNSDAPFNIGIVPPTTVGLVSPNGGETYFRTQQKNILWNSLGNIDTVDISYSSNNGSSWQVIANTVIDNGSYTWVIPNITSTNCLVRVLKSSNYAIGDTSDALFSILPAPSINLISPNGGESFYENQAANITWDTAGIDSTININFSMNGGSTYTTIANNVPNTGSYTWTIPSGSVTTQGRIQITGSVVGILRTDQSSNFTISPPLGTLTLTSPNGGELWEYQSIQQITWTSTGSVGNVKLSYSIDSGATWVGINNNTPNDSTENWNSGFGLKSNVIVKVEEVNQPLVYDISDSVFQIIDKIHSIYITSPNQSSGQMWTEGNTRTISWNSVGIFNMVKIYVSDDNGVTYTLIADSVANNVVGSSSYSWLVPHGINKYTCKIKVEEFGDASIWDDTRTLGISDIRTLTIISPNGGEIYNGMDSIGIRWAETGLVHTIQMAYSIDSGLTWNNFHTVQLFDTDTIIKFEAPNQNLPNVLVRASNGAGAMDGSDGVFSINSIPKTISLLPISDTLRFFGRIGIDWTSTGVTNFEIKQSLDSGQTWTQAPGVFYGGPNHFNWSGPNYNTSGVILRVEDQDSSQYYDQSQLLVVEGYSNLDVKTPNGGETVYTDSTVLIEWSHFPGSVSSLTRANIHYSLDTGISWSQIASFLPLATDSSYSWTVPSNLHGNTALIKVSGDGSGNEVNYDISDALFFIKTAPELALVTPDSNDVIYSDSTALITWNSNVGVDHVNLFYRLNTSSNWLRIDSNVIDTGSYLWNVPLGLHSWASVKIEATDSIQIADSNIHVLIKPKFNHLNMIFPNGGEVFEGGKCITASWDWSGVYQFQWELKLSVDTGKTWYNLNDGQHFEGVIDSVGGTLPNLTSTKCLMAITSYPYGDTSDAFFTINFNPTVINITSPNGGGTYLGNTTNKITWDTTSNSYVDSVYIGVRVGSGSPGGVKKVLNSGSAELVIPNLFSTNNAKAWVKLDCYSISDESDSAFSIITTTNDTIVLISPNGGEQLISGQQTPILWQASNSIDFIDVEFSADSGVTWISLANSIPNCGYYLWTVPSMSITAGVIRISGNTKALLTDVSDSTFGVTLSTGIIERAKLEFSIYPNPIESGNDLNIKGLPKDAKLEIISIQGKVIAKLKMVNNSVSIPSSISSGTYFIRMRDNYLNSYHKLIIE